MEESKTRIGLRAVKTLIYVGGDRLAFFFIMEKVRIDAEKLQYLRKADKAVFGIPVHGLRGDDSALQPLQADFKPVQMQEVRAGRALRESGWMEWGKSLSHSRSCRTTWRISPD